MTENTAEESLYSVREWVEKRWRQAAMTQQKPYRDVYEAVNVELLLVMRRLDLELEMSKKSGRGT